MKLGYGLITFKSSVYLGDRKHNALKKYKTNYKKVIGKSESKLLKPPKTGVVR
jgi:hypothetical protein